jgi:hypothetical protein
VKYVDDNAQANTVIRSIPQRIALKKKSDTETTPSDKAGTDKATGTTADEIKEATTKPDATDDKTQEANNVASIATEEDGTDETSETDVVENVADNEEVVYKETTEEIAVTNEDAQDSEPEGIEATVETTDKQPEPEPEPEPAIDEDDAIEKAIEELAPDVTGVGSVDRLTGTVKAYGLSNSSRTYTKTNLNPYAGVGRNQLCPCGSGKKFKKCHGGPNPPKD